MRGLICQLLHKLVSLNVDVLSASQRLRGAHITLEEFLAWAAGLVGSLRLARALPRFPGVAKQVVGVGSRWDDHGGMSRPTDHTTVIHHVLRHVFPIAGQLFNCLEKRQTNVTYFERFVRPRVHR